MSADKLVDRFSYEEINEMKIELRYLLTESPKARFKTLKQMRAHYGVGYKFFKRLFKGEIFPEIPPGLDGLYWRFNKNAGKPGNLTREQVLEIRRHYYNRGLSCKKIKTLMKLNISVMGIWKIATGVNYANVQEDKK